MTQEECGEHTALSQQYQTLLCAVAWIGRGQMLWRTSRLLACGSRSAPPVPAHCMKAPCDCPAAGSAAGAARECSVRAFKTGAKYRVVASRAVNKCRVDVQVGHEEQALFLLADSTTDSESAGDRPERTSSNRHASSRKIVSCNAGASMSPTCEQGAIGGSQHAQRGGALGVQRRLAHVHTQRHRLQRGIAHLWMGG